MSREEPNELFHCAIPDDSAAPDFPRGLEMIWSKSKAPSIGSLVIVKDKLEGMHIRTYVQGRTPGRWIAAPVNKHYASFDSDEDGLSVVAVAAFMALP